MEANDACAILAATRDLLERIVAENGIRADELVSVVFTATPDLNAAFPARAARDMGWDDVPLMCMQEMAVPGGLAGCIRVLVHWDSNLPRQAVHHVYLGRASELRPDMAAAL